MNWFSVRARLILVLTLILLSGYVAGDTLDTLMARADKALYQAKEAGRNRVVESDETG